VDRLGRLVCGSADLVDDAVTPAVLDRYYEAGGRSLDLANVYGDGESARGVGRWLEATGRRDELVLFVKGCHPPLCSPSLVESEVEQARAALGVELLDNFMLHRDDLAFPVAAWGEALLREVARGTIRSFGVSNWMNGRFEELRAELGGDARHLTTFSNQFALVEMVTPAWPGTLTMTTDDLEALAGEGILALAWSSLGAGYLTGNGNPSWESPGNEQRRARARELAQNRGTTATAIGLAYVLHQPDNVLALIGTRSVQHLDELLSAAAIDLSDDEVAWLEHG
jgi:aryl-alcohol dehydrogenase-like predicted oxidoreductase